MKKIGLICLAFILAMGGLGVSYALWSETLVIDGTVNTGEVDWEFYNIYYPEDLPEFDGADQGIDPGWTKDVGSTDAVFVDSDGDGDYDTLVLTVLNAYPFYRNHGSTWVHCNGSVPIIIVGAWISFDGGPEIWLPWGQWATNSGGTLRVNFGDNYGQQLHFCDSLDVSLAFEVLQPAQQNMTGGNAYTFSIRYEAVQYNEAT